jgi:hypothetical protein
MRLSSLAGYIMHNADIASFHLEMDDLVQVVAEVFQRSLKDSSGSR